MVRVMNALALGTVVAVNGATATVRVGIGTTNLPTLGKGAGPSIADGWATYSARRWKTKIQPLQNALGMVEQRTDMWSTRAPWHWLSWETHPYRRHSRTISQGTSLRCGGRTHLRTHPACASCAERRRACKRHRIAANCYPL